MSRNVAVVVLDTLRKDAFDRHFEWLPGVRFERAFTTADWTVPAHGSLFTGLYPRESGVHAKNTVLDTPKPTLAERLSDNGYTTRAYSSNVNITPAFNFDRGFDYFDLAEQLVGIGPDVYDWESFISETRGQGPTRFFRALSECISGDCATVPSLLRGLRIKLRDQGLLSSPADSGARKALDIIRDTSFGDQEFFFCNLMEAHAPYAPPEEYRTTGENVEELTSYNSLIATMDRKAPGVDDETLRAAYDDSARYLSDIYEEIFAILNDTFDIVITLADHGECLGENGVYQHSYGLAPQLTHVPLVVSGVGTEDIREDPVSIIDVHATILSATGTDGDSDGHSLFDSPDRSVYTEYHGVNHQNRQKVQSEGKSLEPYDEPLFGVATPCSAYAYEDRDGVRKPDDVTVDLIAEWIAKHQESTNRRHIERREREVSDSVKQQLEDLGYA